MLEGPSAGYAVCIPDTHTIIYCYYYFKIIGITGITVLTVLVTVLLCYYLLSLYYSMIGVQ